jgi:hypothetical protein
MILFFKNYVIESSLKLTIKSYILLIRKKNSHFEKIVVFYAEDSRPGLPAKDIVLNIC